MLHFGLGSIDEIVTLTTSVLTQFDGSPLINFRTDDELDICSLQINRSCTDSDAVTIPEEEKK